MLAVMENAPKPDIVLAPSLRDHAEWQQVLADAELRAKFTELADLTMSTVDPAEQPWAADRQAVEFRWQHTVAALGNSARSHSHPLFRSWGWGDTEYAQEVLDAVDHRQGERSFIESALALTHSLIFKQGRMTTPGLAVSLSTINNKQDFADYDEALQNIFDLRDMHEPVSLMEGISEEDFMRMDDDALKLLGDKIDAKLFGSRHRYGKGGGWDSTPQITVTSQDAACFGSYQQIREYGTADHQEIDAILIRKKREEVTQLQAQDPNYGKLSTDTLDALSEQDKTRIAVLLFNCLGQRFEPYHDLRTISLHLRETYNFSEEDIQLFEASGVIVIKNNVDDEVATQVIETLSEDYYAYWVTWMLARREE